MKALSFAEAAQFEPGKKFIQTTKRMVKASFNRWAAERGIPNDDLRMFHQQPSARRHDASRPAPQTPGSRAR